MKINRRKQQKGSIYKVSFIFGFSLTHKTHTYLFTELQTKYLYLPSPLTRGTRS